MINLERLIQMATIEQMYNMLQQMKSDNSSNVKECNFSDGKYSAENNGLTCSLLKTEIDDHTEKLRRNNSEYWQLSQTIQSLQVRIQQLETELNEIKSNNNNNNNSKFVCQQICGQQKFTGFSNGVSNEKIDESHIKLKIEEKFVEAKCEADIELNNFDEDKLEEDNTTKNIGAEIHEEKYNDETDDEDVKEEEDVVTEDEHGDEDVKEEEEVVTDDETEVLAKEADTVREYIQEKDKTVEEKFEEEESEEEVVTEDESEEKDEELSVGEDIEPTFKDEEEVFEIEIDDVTYFATGEENGILYEMTSDGDIGKKVGIIKDGEPIFN